MATRFLPSLPPIWRRRLRLALRIVGVMFVLGLVALIVAVYIQKSQLPSFDSLKSSPNGQMIRVHAADGTVIVSLGPSYGEWIPIYQTPRPMRDAMVSIEDRRFYSHFGIDLRGLLRSAKVVLSRGTNRRIQ